MTNTAPPTNRDQVLLAGIAFMLVGTSLLPVMNSFAKTIAAEFPLWEVTWARFTGHLLVMCLVFVPRHGWAVFKTASPALQFSRSTVFFVSNACFIGALPLVSLATASSIMFTAPIIVTALSVLFLGERVGPWRWGAVLVGFLGAIVIVRPGTTEFEPATLLVLVSACMYSIYLLLTRRLAEHDSAPTQIIYTVLVGSLVTSFIVPFVGRVPEEPVHIMSFFAVGLIGGFAHLLVIQALRRAPASVVAPFGYIELITATILGFLVFGDLPAWTTWLGAGLIVLSGLVIVWREGVTRGGSAGPPLAVASIRPQRTAPNRIPEAMVTLGLALIAVAIWLA